MLLWQLLLVLLLLQIWWQGITATKIWIFEVKKNNCPVLEFMSGWWLSWKEHSLIASLLLEIIDKPPKLQFLLPHQGVNDWKDLQVPFWSRNGFQQISVTMKSILLLKTRRYSAHANSASYYLSIALFTCEFVYYVIQFRIILKPE